jgi:cephalosporin-C deacetylase
MEDPMPLTFDYSLEECAVYQGINPRPADFDAYWERALNEMKAVDPYVEYEPAAFQAQGCECMDMYFTGVGGARIHAKLLRPRKASAPHPAVLMFHGYTGNAGDWVDKLPYVAQGFTVAAMDCRGQGGSSTDSVMVSGNTLHGHIIRGLDDALNGNPDKLMFRQVFLDTAMLARIVLAMPDVDPDRVGVFGGSQGGALTVACSALEPRIRRIAPVYPFLSDYKRVWSMDQGYLAYQELKEYFRFFDPTHQNEDRVFEQLGYIDIQNLAARIQAEVLWGMGLMDVTCPPSSQFAAYNKITAPKNMVIYPDYDHELLPGFNDRTFQFMMGLK